MAHEFKVGDIALVVGGEALLGHQVRIHIWVEPNQEFTNSKGGMRRYNPSSGRSGWYVENGVKGAVKQPKHLMPLKGKFEPEHQKAKEAEPCA